MHVRSAEKSEHAENYKLQAVFCETTSQDPNVVNLAIRNKLAKIGGWFSVRRLLQLFDEDAVFERNLRKHKGDADLYFDRPSDIVLQVLPDLLPQAGLPKPDYQGHDKAALVQSWKKWIADHENELARIEPTGSGVDLSADACKNGKPVRKPGAPR
jgi:hypothetical protein